MARKIFIIPCTEDRKQQLVVFLKELKQREPVTTEFYVVAQDMKDPFDRGMSLNMGFLASKAQGTDVVIFHDVDVIPVEAYPCGYPTPSKNEILHLYGHEHSCGGIYATTAECYKHLGGHDSNPRWGGEDVAMQTRAHTFGVCVNKKRMVKRFQGNEFAELDRDGEPIPNKLAHREWEREIFIERRNKKIRTFHVDPTKPGSLQRSQGIYFFGCELIENQVFSCNVRIKKLGAP
jgi:hypothetical protein